MLKTKLIKLTQKEWIIYTFIFIAISFMGFSPLFVNKYSTIWNIDGIGQYYPAFLYIGKYVRTFIMGVFNGSLNLPVYDLSIGMGEDIIGALNYYGFGDPINLFAVFANETNGSYIFTFTYFLRLYIAGWTINLYCKKMNIGMYSRILSSLIFAFNGFAISGAMMYIEWESVLIYFPLMLIGAENIIKKTGRYKIFMFAVCYGALCGFYYLYMCSIALALYFVLRLISMHGVKNIFSLFLQCVYALCAYLLGIGLASPILLPAIRAYFNSERNSQLLSILFDISQYKPSIRNLCSCLYRSVIPSNNGGGQQYILGVLIIEWIVILMYFISSWNRRKLQLFIGFCISMIAISVPITGYLFNGFGETNNRWVYLVHILLTVIFATALSELKSITIELNWTSITYTFRELCIVVYLLVIVNIVFNIFYSFSGFGANWKETFIEFDKANLYTNSPVDESFPASSTEIYRVSNDSLTGVNGRPENIAMLHEYYGLTYWLSIVNQYTQEYVDASNNETMSWRSFGFNNDIYTEALAGCKYYFSSEPKYDSEYVFIKDITFNDNTWYVYENPYYLGMAYTTDNASSYNTDSEVSLEEFNAWMYSFVSAQDIYESKYDNMKGIYSCNTNAESDTCLVVALPYNQNWKAYIDGTEVTIVKSNMYMSIDIPSGYHSVEFKYSHNLNYVCMVICGIILFGGIGLKKSIKWII